MHDMHDDHDLRSSVRTLAAAIFFVTWDIYVRRVVKSLGGLIF